MEDRDLRNVILLLVKAHKMRQSHAAALRVLCRAVLDESSKRKLTSVDLDVEYLKIQAQTDPVADLEARDIEAALTGGGPFLEQLRIYASRQFLSPRPEGTLP
jgi:hypothetical protein